MYNLDDPFIDSYGLVNSRKDEQNAENSFLWSVELFCIMRNKGVDTHLIERRLDNALDKMHVSKGIYKQNPSYPDPKDHNVHEAYMSHDQLTAILVYCKITGKQKIIEDILDQFAFGIIYDNKNPEDPSIDRTFHPRDIIYYQLLSKNVFRKLTGICLSWILYIITLYTFATHTKTRNGNKIVKTDNEIIHYIRREASWVFFPINWICNLAIKIRFKGWSKVWRTYFREEGHPIPEAYDG